MESLREYLRIAEAATLIGVCPATLRNWVAEGKIKAHVNPANRYRLFRRADLEKFLSRVARPAKTVRTKKAK